jgi:hypothetical protein
MQHFISHRGNINGKSPSENTPTAILQAVSLNYEVQIDVWRFENDLYLGSDNPDIEIKIDFLEDIKTKVWCNCRNLSALEYLLNLGYHCFIYENNSTLTSKGFVWTSPNAIYIRNSVCVTPEIVGNDVENMENCVGVCSDFIAEWLEDYKLSTQKVLFMGDE